MVSGFTGFLSGAQNKFCSPAQLLEYCKRYKVIIPLRDPLLAVLTRWKRHPTLSTDYILHAFNWLQHLDMENVYFFPVDIIKPDNITFVGMLNFLGMPMPNEKTMEYVCKWEKQNTAGPTELDYLYEQKIVFRDLSILEPATIAILRKQGYNCYWMDKEKSNVMS